jgi:regulatory protein YycI of two-component signal transduction system YycFG
VVLLLLLLLLVLLYNKKANNHNHHTTNNSNNNTNNNDTPTTSLQLVAMSSAPANGVQLRKCKQGPLIQTRKTNTHTHSHSHTHTHRVFARLGTNTAKLVRIAAERNFHYMQAGAISAQPNRVDEHGEELKMPTTHQHHQ